MTEELKARVSQMSRTYQNTIAADAPAGSRMPKPFKKTYADKMPEWIIKFRQEGLSDTEINDILKGKANKYINKWGNCSKVGILINNYNAD